MRILLKKLLAFVVIGCFIVSPSFAGVNNITELDGSPSVFPWKIKFPNSTVTDNGDGSVSVAGSTGDVTSVGDCASGACFDGTQGTVLTFYNAGGNATETYDGSNIIFSKAISSPGAGSSSEHFGASSLAAGFGGVAVGNSASAKRNFCTAIGGGGTVAGGSFAGNTNDISIGYQAGSGTELSYNILIGNSVGAGGLNYCTVISHGGSPTADSQFVGGSPTQNVTDIYFGSGPLDSTPIAYSIHGTGGSGSNIAGAALNVDGGIGTGTGVGGAINFKTALHGTTGSSANTLATVGSFDETGKFTVSGHTVFEGVTSTGATGTGNIVYSGSPTLVTPALGTPASGVLTNCTGTAASLTAGSATVLANARTIGGTSFNGSANIDPLEIVPTTTPADSTGFGIIVSYTYGESITLGAPLYFKSDGKVYNADANGSSTYPVIGIALATASSGSNNVLLRGIYQFAAAHTDFTVGGLVYLSTTVGTLTQTQPSATDDVIQVVGVAVGADTLLVNPSSDYMTHT